MLGFATAIKCVARLSCHGLELDSYCGAVDCLLVLNTIRISKFLFHIQVVDVQNWLRKPSEEIFGESRTTKFGILLICG